MKQNICVFDFETDSSNPNKCNPVQLCAVMLDNRTLEIIKDSEFEVLMRPTNFDEPDYKDEHWDTIQWHAKNYNVTPQEIYDKWDKFPAQKQGWNSFTQYLKRYNKNQARKTKWTAPIRAGANIRNFDMTIMNRLCSLYKNVDKNGDQNIFFPRDVIDITEISFYWFENLSEPEAYNMDALRKFFGMSGEGAHDGMVDVRDEAWMIQKYLRLFRHLAPKVPFKGAYNGRQQG